MDGYQLIADLFKSLMSASLPLALFGIVYMFKKPLAELLPYLEISYKEFRLSLRKVEQKAEALPEPKEPPAKDEEFQKLLDISPAAAVVHVRRELEAALMAYAEARGMTRIPIGLYRYPKELLRQDLIDQTTADVLTGLAKTAAAASHSSSTAISVSDALRFRDVAERLMSGLEILRAAAGMSPPGQITQS